MSEITVSELNVYPIKSCGAATEQTVQFGELGLLYDREMMLVGSRGQFISQRVQPRLALVETAIERSSNEIELQVKAPSVGNLDLDLRSFAYLENPEMNIDLFKKPGRAREVSQEASDFFSQYLSKEVKLVIVTGARTIKPECQVNGAVTKTGFADGFPILLTARESLNDLNGKMDAPVSMSRFRANVVVEGAPAYDEDYWRSVKLGDIQAYVVRACARCPIPNIDQAIGELPKKRSVTEALREHRSGTDPINNSAGEFFGQNLTHVFRDGSTLSVGDQVQVLERSDKRNLHVQ